MTTTAQFLEPHTLPGPRGLPLLGNALDLKADRVHRVFEAWARDYGPVFRFRIGPRTLVGIADAGMIRQILHERPEHYRRRNIETIAEQMGIRGVFMSEGEDWRRQRRLWIAALNAHQVKPFLGELGEVTQRLHRRWTAAAARNKAIDVQAELMRYTVDVVTRFALGYDGNTLEQDGDVIQNHLHHVFPMLAKRLNAPFHYWRHFRLPADRRLDRALAAIRAFVDRRIAEARTRLAAEPGRAAHPRNLLEAFLVARAPDGDTLDDDEIFANVVTALLAGEDTTANTLAWMIHFLAGEPALQRELQAGVDALPAAEPWTPPPETAPETAPLLRLIDAVMSETLRLKPVAPVMGATALTDVELGRYRFARGTEFVTVMRPAALDAREFADPETFRPQRWLEAGATHFAQRPPSPFGGGARTCPGRNLAQTEVRTVVAMLMRGYSIEPAPGPGPVTEHYGFTMGPENLRVRLQPRPPAR